MSQAPHIAILSSPGMGHLIPAVELAKNLIVHHGLSATLITFSNFSSPSHHSFLASLPVGLCSLSLPHIPLDDLPADARIDTRLSVLISRSVPYVTTALLTLKSTTVLAAYIVDVFGGDTFTSAVELGIPRFIFSTSTFMFLSLMLHLPALDATISSEYRDLREPVRLPGCVPVNGKDLVDPMQDRTNESYRWVLQLAERFRESEGFLVNSYEDLEPEAAKVLSKREDGRPPVYPVGPLIREAFTGEDSGSECLQWLDKQPAGSVLFVSFGSGGTLSSLQVRELAAGLEMSGRRFLWVARIPNDREATGTFFGQGGVDEVLHYLPDGFVKRTTEVGLVVPSWVPQVQVLGHRSTGGFMSHCGWNSALESIMNGVPLIAWPLYAEQRMNAVMLAATDGVGVALRPEVTREDGVVGREEIARVVRELMGGKGGEAARERVREMQVAATKAMTKEGSSYKALARWKDSIGVKI